MVVNYFYKYRAKKLHGIYFLFTFVLLNNVLKIKKMSNLPLATKTRKGLEIKIDEYASEFNTLYRINNHDIIFTVNGERCKLTTHADHGKSLVIDYTHCVNSFLDSVNLPHLKGRDVLYLGISDADFDLLEKIAIEKANKHNEAFQKIENIDSEYITHKGGAEYWGGMKMD